MPDLINFSTDKFIERFLPLHKNTPNRIKWLQFLLSELKDLWQEYYDWRKDFFYRLNLTSQTMVMEYHLNKVIPGANGDIRIIHYDDQGVNVALEEEGIPYLEVGLIDISGEENDYIYAALEGEIQEAIGVDFRVSVPTGVNINEVAGVVDSIKLGGKSYEIVQG